MAKAKRIVSTAILTTQAVLLYTQARKKINPYLPALRAAYKSRREVWGALREWRLIRRHINPHSNQQEA